MGHRLIANKTGEVSIPAIKLGSLSSQPIVMKIISAEAAAAGEQNNSAKAGTQPRYSMKAEINNKNPYVQQQVDYTVTILDTGGLQGDAPYFSDNGGNDGLSKRRRHRQSTAKRLTARQSARLSSIMPCFRKKAAF